MSKPPVKFDPNLARKLAQTHTGWNQFQGPVCRFAHCGTINFNKLALQALGCNLDMPQVEMFLQDVYVFVKSFHPEQGSSIEPALRMREEKEGSQWYKCSGVNIAREVYREANANWDDNFVTSLTYELKPYGDSKNIMYLEVKHPI